LHRLAIEIDIRGRGCVRRRRGRRRTMGTMGRRSMSLVRRRSMRERMIRKYEILLIIVL